MINSQILSKKINTCENLISIQSEDEIDNECSQSYSIDQMIELMDQNKYPKRSFKIKSTIIQYSPVTNFFIDCKDERSSSFTKILSIGAM